MPPHACVRLAPKSSLCEDVHMTFDEVLTNVIDLLQRQERVSYRALKRRFDLDDDYL
jgi:hypothetical protein